MDNPFKIEAKGFKNFLQVSETQKIFIQIGLIFRYSQINKFEQ